MEQISYILQQVVNGIQLGAVYALIALGYTMVYGVLRLINFAHGDVFMLGAFVAYFLISKFGLPVYLVFILTMVSCALVGYVIEKVAYKPLRDAPKISLLITAVGVSLFLEYFLSLKALFTPNYIPFPRPFRDRDIRFVLFCHNQCPAPYFYYNVHFSFYPLSPHIQDKVWDCHEGSLLR